MDDHEYMLHDSVMFTDGHVSLAGDFPSNDYRLDNIPTPYLAFGF
jgi:hypothetical protein